MNIKNDNEVMNVLKVSEIRHMLAHTNVGDLTLLIRKGETEYTFCLDAVPVDREQQVELIDLYFPKPVIVPSVNKGQVFLHNLRGKTESSTEKEMEEIIKKLPKKPIKSKKK